MGISLKEAVENKLISDECISIIPKKCKCGSDLEFNESLKWLKCTNSKCTYNIIYNILHLSKLTCIKISKEDATKAVNELKLISHYQFFILDTAIEHNRIQLGIDVEKIKLFRKTPIYIYEIVKLCCDVTIERIAKSLFFGFNSFDEAYEEIENAQVSFINSRLGIKNTESTALSYEIYNRLLKLKDEFIFIESQLTIKKHENRLNIVFSDNTIPFINKLEFIEFLNTKYNYTFCIRTIIKDTTDILIKNSDEDNVKSRLASMINERNIAYLMNTGQIDLFDVGKFSPYELKPVGNIIFITSIDKLIKHLDDMVEHSNE